MRTTTTKKAPRLRDRGQALAAARAGYIRSLNRAIDRATVLLETASACPQLRGSAEISDLARLQVDTLCEFRYEAADASTLISCGTRLTDRDARPEQAA